MISVHQNRFLIKLSAYTAKACALLVAYALVIFGIFALQFNNETLILRTIGAIRLELREIKLSGGAVALKNDLSLRYRGLQVYATKAAPALILYGDGSSAELTLESWTSVTDTFARFQFSHGVYLTVTYGDTDADFQCAVILPPEAAAVTIKYRSVDNYEIVESNGEHTVFGSRRDRFVLNTPSDASRVIVFRADSPRVTYRPAQPESALSFEALVGLDLASENTFRATENALTDALIRAFENRKDTMVGEETVIAYLQAMGERGQLETGLGRVPGIFITSGARTYVSAPYFNTLARMAALLGEADDEFRGQLTDAVQTQSIDFFTRADFAEFLLRCSDRDLVTAFLLLPAATTTFEPSIFEAAAILDTYTVLSASGSSFAALLEPVIAKCLAAIPMRGSLYNDRFVLSDDTGQLDHLNAVHLGSVLIRYAAIKPPGPYLDVGRLIIDSVCTGNEAAFDLYTLTVVYRNLNSRSRYSPHTELLAELATGPLWVWTASDGVTYTADNLRTATVGIDFPVGHIHHLIFGGLNPFTRIEIHTTSYRSARDFETYSASGYVYDSDTRTLLLRLRQRDAEEIVRFTN
jgi:hypothetical protein